MNSNWPSLTIEEVCDRLIDYRGKTPKKTDAGIRLVTAKVVKSGRILDDRAEFISEAEYERWMTRGIPEMGDVLLTTEAPLGEVAILRTDEKIALAQRIILLRAKSGILDGRYLLYALQIPLMQGRLSARASGTTVIGIKNSELRKVELPVPSLHIQQRIASILSAYDDLIENNRRRIQLLEQAARLLYREWFVHLRFPGHEHVKIKDGVPEGWEMKELGELCTLRAGGVFKPKYQGQTTGDYPFIKVRDMNSAGNGVSITEADNWVTSDTCSEFRGRPFPSGTSVFAKIGEGLRQNRVRFIVQDTLIDNNMMGAIPNRKVVDEPFIYYLLSNYDIASNASGAAVPFLSAKVLSKIRFLVPDLSTQHHFNSAIAPMLEQITNLQRQNTEAAKARDLLLPRLMNGGVAV